MDRPEVVYPEWQMKKFVLGSVLPLCFVNGFITLRGVSKDKRQKDCIFKSEFSEKELLHMDTLISLLNVGPTLTGFETFHPPQKKINPPRLLIP